MASEVLVAPHHGHYERNLKELLDRVKPRVVVISGPLTESVRRALDDYRRYAARVLVTGECGAVTVTLTSELRVRTWGSR